mmetsp:Transcript_134943/g.419326  ORF Transcript_134943/g.419326 Transcript_134943/m.419326 type:complete len:107 (+) Transcript_134943:34-354(+)
MPHPEARGCLSLLVHRTEVLPDPQRNTVFMLRPVEKEGWAKANVSFTGGEHRVFHFDTQGGEVSRDDWIKALRRHIEFADLVRRQLGPAQVLQQVRVHKPFLPDLD